MNILVIRKIALGFFISTIVHIWLWFFLEMHVSHHEVLRNLVLLIISFLVWILSILGFIIMTSKKIKKIISKTPSNQKSQSRLFNKRNISKFFIMANNNSNKIKSYSYCDWEKIEFVQSDMR